MKFWTTVALINLRLRRVAVWLFGERYVDDVAKGNHFT